MKNYWKSIEEYGKDPKEIDNEITGELDIEEKFIFSRLNSTIKEVTELFEQYKLDEIPSKIESLFLDLSRIYIKIIRDKIHEDILKKKKIIVAVPFLPARLYCWYLRLLDRRAHPELIKQMVESLGHDSVVQSNPVQESIAPNAVPPRDVLDPYIKKRAKLPPNPRQSFIKKHIADLRSKNNVRSIQRIVLPPDRNATWVAESYFLWLPRFTRLLVICEVDDTGTCHYYNRFPRLHLLSLSFQQGHSSPDRRMYFITEGLLTKESEGLYPRMEFRDVLNGRYTIVALHDFIPVLPWGLYFVTQAIIHMIVMRNFQKYIAKIASDLAPRN